jgi:hypothetical protein
LASEDVVIMTIKQNIKHHTNVVIWKKGNPACIKGVGMVPVSGLPKTIHLGETSMMEEYKNLYFPNIKCNYLSISLDFFSDFVFLSFY